jgi:hypothetical protein
MVGCGGGGESYTLTVNSTAGGVVAVNNVIIPGTAMFTYDPGTVVSLNATPDVSYEFVKWTGNVGTIGDVNASATHITMSGNYSITANFFHGQLIRNWYDLDAIRNNLSDNYLLMNDLDSTVTGYDELASPTANGGQGWQPIGNETNSLTSSFDGQGYEICDLVINRPVADFAGLFGAVGGEGIIQKVRVVDIDVTGLYYVGGLLGRNWGNVSDCYASGSVSGFGTVGGLLGANWGNVSDCYAMANVSSSWEPGGLVGENYGAVSNSCATGSVSGSWDVGGLVGLNHDWGTVSNSYATGTVSGDYYAGGLVGLNHDRGTVSNSYATGTVSGDYCAGGLVGCNYEGTVSNSYATGTVTGTEYVGGLLGANEGTVSNSYATGTVTGTEYVGGLLGYNQGGTVTNSFWDTETSGQSTSDGGTGRNTTEMHNITTFSGATWNITAVANPSLRNLSYIWNIVNNVTYPFLSWQPI